MKANDFKKVGKGKEKFFSTKAKGRRRWRAVIIEPHSPSADSTDFVEQPLRTSAERQIRSASVQSIHSAAPPASLRQGPHSNFKFSFLPSSSLEHSRSRVASDQVTHEFSQLTCQALPTENLVYASFSKRWSSNKNFRKAGAMAQ